MATIPQSGVLGFSKQLGKYQVIHGKHRLAALKYLNSIGKVPNSLIVNYPVISYDWVAGLNSENILVQNAIALNYGRIDRS